MKPTTPHPTPSTGNDGRLAHIDNLEIAEVGESYRFGFNGKENDNETYGTGNAIAFEARIGRLGRWLSVDPAVKEYPNLSPYGFCASSPIMLVEIDGAKESVTQTMADHLGIAVRAFMARSEYSDIYGTRIYNKMIGEDAYKAMKIPGYGGKLYLRGAAFGVKGSTVQLPLTQECIISREAKILPQLAQEVINEINKKFVFNRSDFCFVLFRAKSIPSQCILQEFFIK